MSASDPLASLRRLQWLTILLVFAAIGVLAWARAGRAPAAPVGAGGPSRAEVEALIAEALGKLPAAAKPAVSEADLADVRAAIARLGDGVTKASDAASAAATAARAPQVSVDRFEQRWLCRFRAPPSGVEWRSLPLGAADAGPYPTGDEAGWPRWTALGGSDRLAEIAVPLPADHKLRSGVLFVEAIVRTDQNATESPAHPIRLALACVEAAGGRQLFDLAGGFFPTHGSRDEALEKSAATTAAFAVGAGAELRLVVDTQALAYALARSSTLDVYVRVGPLVATDGAVQR